MSIFATKKVSKLPKLPSETSGHLTVASWLDRRSHFWHHSPMGGKRTKKEGKLLRAMGARAGIPDFLVFTPPPNGKYVGAAMEFKRDDGGDGGSEEQLETLEKLANCGWATYLASGDRDAIDWLIRMGY